MRQYYVVALCMLLLLSFFTPVSSNAAQPISDKVIGFSEDVAIYMTADIIETDYDIEGQSFKTTKSDMPICSGFVLETKKTEELIITARHCVKSTDDLTIVPRSVHFFDGDVARIKRYYASKNYDVAILWVTSMRKHRHATLHQHYKRGENLFLMGMPDGRFWSYSSATPMQGEQEAPDKAPFNHMTLLECVSCYHGNSGGGIFNRKGEVVGLLSATTGPPGNFLMTSSKRIRDTLKEVAYHL